MPLTGSRSTWLIVAIASGGCAAFNGVFAKLTTTELTTSWASAVSKAFSLDPSNMVVEVAIRVMFFALNLLFNAVMWGLFTRALTLASSTVRVSIINTSANFIVTAVLSALIFSESLPGLWWVGAALLVAGSVIIGMREENEKTSDGHIAPGAATGDALLGGDHEDSRTPFKDDDDADAQSALELNSVHERGSKDSTDEEDNTLK